MKLRELLNKMLDIQKKIGASEPFACGGAPRDRYMGRLDNIADIDITTGDETVNYLSQEFATELGKKYNVKRTTASDGHSTVYLGSFKMDFSSNFNVPGIEQYLLKLGIKNPTSMQKEIFSRDMTCNALLLSFDLKNLIDPTHRGFQDIKDRMIRTCLDPAITLTTNKNRVIRAIYLAAKLDFDIDPNIITYVQHHPETVNIATNKVLTEKMSEAFQRDPDKASYLLTKMGLWNLVPISRDVFPYYEKHLRGNIVAKKAYFQVGGVNNPTSSKKKYEINKSIIDQPRFKSLFFRNYDLYNNDDYMLPPKEHGTKVYDWKNSPYQGTPRSPKHHHDKNDLDFSIDDQVTPIIGYSESYNSPIQMGPSAPDDMTISPNQDNLGNYETYPAGAQLGGYLDKYLEQPDLDDKPESTLDFGYDLSNEDEEPMELTETDLEKLFNKYLNPTPNHGQFGLPDGLDLPDEDLGDPTNLNPDYGTLGPESLMYEDKWNI